MRINKKAVMEDFLQLIAWSIVIVIVCFIFTGIKTGKTKSLIDKSKDIENEINGNYLLIDFLKQKTKNPNAENMAELISLYYETKDEKVFNEIKQNVNDYFSKHLVETSGESWSFSIYDNEKREVKRIEGPLVYNSNLGGEKIISSIIIPLKDDRNKYLIIEISSIELIWEN